MTQILGICGSPRANGNSEFALNTFLSYFGTAEEKVDTVLLSSSEIRMCIGCLNCEDKGMCPLSDDMAEISKKMKTSDIIVFSSPSYFDNIPGVFKNFIDRTNLIIEELKDKKVVILIVGQADENSRLAAASVLKSYCDIAGMEVIGEITFSGRDIGDLSQDESVVNQIEDLAKRVCESR